MFSKLRLWRKARNRPNSSECDCEAYRQAFELADHEAMATDTTFIEQWLASCINNPFLRCSIHTEVSTSVIMPGAAPARGIGRSFFSRAAQCRQMTSALQRNQRLQPSPRPTLSFQLCRSA